MQPLKFTQWAICELKRDVTMDFNLTASGNKMSLFAYDKEISTLELIHEPDSNEMFPYSFAYVSIPRERPCAQLIDKVELHEIYAASGVQETQELALDPMYVSECALEAPKPKAVHLDWAPGQLENEPPMLAILSTYGACQVLSKQATGRYWQHQLCDLSKFLISDAFPLAKTPADIAKFDELKAFIDLYWITAFAWEPEPMAYGRIIYTANAAGYIVALKLNQDDGEIVEYCRLKTSLGRISYIKAFGGQFLLVANVLGVVQLLRITHGELPSMEAGEYLWSKADRMTCRKAEAMYSSKVAAFFLVFCKGAHVLAFHISKVGSVICSSTLYVTGAIKITGLAALAADEYIVTTITASVRHIRLTILTGDDDNNTELKIEEQIATTEIDSTNLQIIGVATTQNRNIWSFLLCRNKEYGHGTRFSQLSVFVSVCKLNTIDSLTILANLNIKTMDDWLDYTVALRLDIFNNFDAEKYADFFELTNAKFPKSLNDAFLQKLQIKLMIVKKLMQYQRIKIKTVKKLAASEYKFLLRATQITHILCRMRHLRQVALLNPVQILSARCMLLHLARLLVELLTLANGDSAGGASGAAVNNENPLKHTIERFVKLAEDELAGIAFAAASYADSEKCLDCSGVIDVSTMLCASEHKVQRCSVSYMQIPLFSRRFCPHCRCFALDDEDTLQQLFAPGDMVKCTFCRFLFVHDEI